MTIMTPGKTFRARSYFMLLCGGIVVLLLGSAHAADNNRAATSAAAPKYTQGLLWKIETPGQRSSYIFGTIHTDDARVIELPQPVKTAFNRADSFIMEVLADAEGLAAIAAGMVYDGDQTLAATIGPKLYAETRQALADRGLPPTAIEKQKPWVAVMLLSMPPPTTGQFLDLLLYRRAVEQKKPAYGLETAAEQIEVFDGLMLPDQIALLKETLRARHHFNKYWEQLIAAYLARDLAALMAVAKKHGLGDARLQRVLEERLLGRRNRIMAARMEPRLKEGNAFVAVGAAHLPGRDGVLQLLERNGHRVTAVY